MSTLKITGPYVCCPQALRMPTPRLAPRSMSKAFYAEHDRIELLARAQDAWDRAPQNTMKAVFEWRGKNYVVSHSSVQLRIHTEEGIKVY